MSLELIIATFENNENAAAETYEKTVKLKKEGALELEYAAVVVKTSEGEVKVKDYEDVDKKGGTIFGAITGGIIGLIGGPVGAIVGAAAGAATGRVTANLADYGVPNDMIEDIEKSLQPGSSAIISFVRMNWADRAVARLEENGATVYHETIDDTWSAGDAGSVARSSAQK